MGAGTVSKGSLTTTVPRKQHNGSWCPSRCHSLRYILHVCSAVVPGAVSFRPLVNRIRRSLEGGYAFYRVVLNRSNLFFTCLIYLFFGIGVLSYHHCFLLMLYPSLNAFLVGKVEYIWFGTIFWKSELKSYWWTKTVILFLIDCCSTSL